MNGETCRTCKFYAVQTSMFGRDKSKGYCHRYPPVAYISGGYTSGSTFPETNDDEWCGEYQHQEGQ